MSKRVLLTGASGFIGRHCIEPLQAAGFEVHAVHLRHQQRHMADVFNHRVDLTDHAEMNSLLEQVRPTHLLHFAWYAVPGKYPSSLENLSWCRATLALAEQFAKRGGTRVVFAGSCFEYDLAYGYCSETLTPSAPATLYGTCKNSTREMLSAFSRLTGISSAWGRIFYLYGPQEPPTRLVPSVILSLLRGEVARCTHGRQLRDFLHVQDVAGAFVDLLQSRVEGPVNIGSGEPVTIRAIVSSIAELMDAAGRVDFGGRETPGSEFPVVIADVGRLRDEVNWRPHWSLHDGLASTIRWWQNNYRLTDQSPRARGN